MNCYDQALYSVVDQMLKDKNCGPEDAFVRNLLVESLQSKIREIGIRTSNASNHAARTTPCYFDLERSFGQMGISVSDLKDMCRNVCLTQEPVQCPEPETRDEDFHKGPEPMIAETFLRELVGCSHIPEYLPPFPGAHTYKTTAMTKVMDKSYETMRERYAEGQLNAQRAINKFYLGCEPSLSLSGGSGPTADIFKVLILDPAKKYSCIDALMPRSEVFDIDIYEAKVEITHAVLNCPFKMEPKMESSRVGGDAEVDIGEVLHDVELLSESEDDEIYWSVPD